MKGNYRYGQKHHRAKLSNDDVELIRQLHPDLSYARIARKFDVSDSTVRDIVKFRHRRYG